MSEPLELELARFEVEQYNENIVDEEIIIHASKQAQDCMDCEEFLDKGIRSFGTIEHGEATLYRAHAAGLIDVTPELEQGIEAIRRRWLRPCSFAETWIAKCQNNGYEIRNLDAFRNCCERANEWFEQRREFERAKSIRDERLIQEPW